MRVVAILACLVAAGCADDVPHPPFWRVTHEGRTSLLVGTMHQEVDVTALSPEVLDAVSRARTVVTEADVRGVSTGALLQAVTLPDGQNVREAVSDDDWDHIARAVSASIEPARAETLQPWFLETSAVGVHLPPVEEPMDAGLVARAEQAGVPLGFFEAWDEQVALLNGLGFDDGLAVLLRTARDVDAAVAEHETWADAFSAGDVDEMTALAFDPDAVAERPAYYERILGRHAAWMNRVEDEVREGDAVIAVGFMHMLTDDGVPARLEAKGYDVRLVAP
jgi:uncharacterized protein YbaP (TraB family)